MIDAPDIALAFAAGLVSFVSPCCLPLVPGYLATVSGVRPGEMGERRFDLEILARSGLFVATFSLLNREFRPSGLIERAGRGGPIVAGAAFAIAWTPCVGRSWAWQRPATAPARGRCCSRSTRPAWRSRSLRPRSRSMPRRAFRFFKRHYAAIQIGSGLVLIAMGVLVLNCELFRLNIEVQKFLTGLGVNVFQSV